MKGQKLETRYHSLGRTCVAPLRLLTDGKYLYVTPPFMATSGLPLTQLAIQGKLETGHGRHLEAMHFILDNGELYQVLFEKGTLDKVDVFEPSDGEEESSSSEGEDEEEPSVGEQYLTPPTAPGADDAPTADPEAKPTEEL